jgi:hypothetical protein
LLLNLVRPVPGPLAHPAVVEKGIYAPAHPSRLSAISRKLNLGGNVNHLSWAKVEVPGEGSLRLRPRTGFLQP